MRGIGGFIMAGLGLGLKDGEQSVKDEYEAFLDTLEGESRTTATI